MKGPCQIKVASGLPQIEIPGIVPFCSLHLSHNTVSVEAVLSTSRTRKVEITLGLGQASVAVEIQVLPSPDGAPPAAGGRPVA